MRRDVRPTATSPGTVACARSHVGDGEMLQLGMAGLERGQQCLTALAAERHLWPAKLGERGDRVEVAANRRDAEDQRPKAGESSDRSRPP
jgi:hypothetical protein